MPNVLEPIREQTDDNDEGLYLPERLPNKDLRSKLLRSKEANGGEKVNACPFGCRESDLDAESYCKHVVGFTDPEDETVYQPIKLRKMPLGVRGTPFRFVDGHDPQMVEPADRLVKISTCSRVYRPHPRPFVVYKPAELPDEESESCQVTK